MVKFLPVLYISARPTNPFLTSKVDLPLVCDLLLLETIEDNYYIHLLKENFILKLELEIQFKNLKESQTFRL